MLCGVTNMEALTVESLLDVVESQLCVHGNRALFVKDIERMDNGFMLFAGEGAVSPFFECVGLGDAELTEHGLNVLRGALRGLKGSDLVICFEAGRVQGGFEIGFRAEGRFISTIDSDELAKPLAVNAGLSL